MDGTCTGSMNHKLYISRAICLREFCPIQLRNKILNFPPMKSRCLFSHAIANVLCAVWLLEVRWCDILRWDGTKMNSKIIFFLEKKSFMPVKYNLPNLASGLAITLPREFFAQTSEGHDIGKNCFKMLPRPPLFPRDLLAFSSLPLCPALCSSPSQKQSIFSNPENALRLHFWQANLPVLPWNWPTSSCRSDFRDVSKIETFQSSTG